MLELYKKENSACLIFAHKATRKNILTAKITQTTVWKITILVTHALPKLLRLASGNN